MTQVAGADREPWIAVSIEIAGHDKFTELPSDTARLGLIVAVWSAAKKRRPSGVFKNERQFREVAGRYARFLDQYVATGFLHRAPVECSSARCRRAFADLPDGAIACHDWHVHQRDHAMRQLAYKSSDAGSDAASDVPSDALGDARSDSGSDSASDSRSDPASRALSLSMSTSPNPTYETGTEVPDSLDAAHRWLVEHRLGIPEAGAIGVELARLAAKIETAELLATFEAVLAEAEREGIRLLDGRQVVTAARQKLAPLYPLPRTPKRGHTRTERETAHAWD
jgi:hypothetical protein